MGSGAAGPGGSGPVGSGGQGGAGPGSTASGTGMGGAGATGTGGAGGAGGTGGTGGTGGGGPTCPTGMVLMQAPNGTYCVDGTEVTVKQYEAWLDTNPSLPKMNDAECGWKASDSYTPRTNGEDGSNCAKHHYNPGATPDLPVVCVDWCDARQYCSSAGKRLCGAIGGGALGFDQPKDPGVDELSYACSEGGKRTYPYPGPFVDKACHGGVGSSGDPVAVKSLASCQGGFPGLYDMVGNVWEWQNACESGGEADDNNCCAKGGSFWDGQNDLTCTAMYKGYDRDYFNKNIGFRCCADAKP